MNVAFVAEQHEVCTSKFIVAMDITEPLPNHFLHEADLTNALMTYWRNVVTLFGNA